MKTRILLLCIAALTVCLQLQSQTLDKKIASTNGSVYTAVQNGDTVYIGGDFTQVGIGKKGLARFNANTDKPQISFPELGGNDYTNTMEPDGSGGFYLSGYFDSYNGKSINTTNIIHVLNNGTLDNSFKQINTDGDIYALKKVKNTLYVGGAFQNIKNVNRPFLAALNSSNGSIKNWIPDMPDNQVLQIDANDSLVFINVAIPYLGYYVPWFCKALKASTGKFITSFPAPSEGNGVSAFKIDNTTLYVGGSFTTFGDSARSHIAAIDISNNSFKIKSWQPSTFYFFHFNSTFNPINCFYRYKNNLFMGGSFTYDDGIAQSSNIIAFDIANGNITYNFATQYPGHNDQYNNVSGVTSFGNKLFVSGVFQNIYNGNNIIASKHNLASYDLNNLSLNTTDNYEPDSTLTGMFADASGNLFISGDFRLVNYVDRISLAAINLNTGGPTSFKPNPYVNSNGDSYINALAIKDSILFAGGYFTNVGTNQLNRNNLAAININNGKADTKWSANTDAEVKCLAIKDSVLYVGGNFTKIKNKTRNFAAAVSTNAAALLSWNPNFNNTVNALLIDNDSIYVGGNFNKVNTTTTRNYLAKVNVTSAALSNWNPAPNNHIHTLIKDSSALYVGGDFKTISTKNIYSVAKFNLSNDTIFTAFNANLRNASAAPSVHGLGLWGNTLFVGATSITKINGVTRGNIAGININDDSATAFNPKPDGAITNLTIGENKLFAGGSWSSLGTNVSPSFFAVFTLEPQTQAINLNFTNLQAKSVTANFTAGSGEKRLVVIKQGGIPASPDDGKSYTANNVFGKGDVTGSGSYVVYAESSTSVHITNLLPNHSYTVNVYEYNGSGSGSDYLTSSILRDTFTTPCLTAAKPGKITGKASNLCGGANNVKYRIDTVANAKSYTWSVPNNCTIVSGRGTVSIKVNISSDFDTGYITVKSVDSCGNSSEADSLRISVNPSATSKIAGNKKVHANQSGLNYSVNNVAGLTYNWAVPAGAIITSGYGTNSIIVTWGTVAGSVTVYASNACGYSSTKSLKVKLNNGIASIDKSEDNLSLQNLTQGSVYPNPAQTECTVLFNAANQAKYTFEIADVIGKIIMQKDINANAGNNYIKFNIGNFARGVYLINIIDEVGNKKTLKFVKE
jgi:hypothetical protein